MASLSALRGVLALARVLGHFRHCKGNTVYVLADIIEVVSETGFFF